MNLFELFVNFEVELEKTILIKFSKPWEILKILFASIFDRIVLKG